VSAHGYVFAGFPNPVDWAVDEVTGFVGGAATAGFEVIVGGLVAWVVDAVVWVVGGVFGFFAEATDPNVQADWFVGGDGPYATTAAIGATLLVLFVFAGIIQGTLSGDVGGMLRRMAVDLPMSVLGMVGLVTVTQALIQLTDVLAAHVLGSFEEQTSDFTAVVVSLGSLQGQQASAFVVFLLGLITVVAGIVLVAELVVREALIYIVVALAPLVFATRLWPATQGAARKLIELLCALIVSKLVIAVALAVAAAAAAGGGSGGEVTALPTPEVYAQDPGGSVTQAVGILLAAAAAFAVAAFSPLLIARLLPLTESAIVAQGVRGAPLRAGQQAMRMGNTAQMMGNRRFSQLAGTKSTGAVGAGAGSGPGALGSGAAGAGAGGGGVVGGAAGGGAAAGGAGAAAAGPAAAVVATVKAVKGAASAGANAATAMAEAAVTPADRPTPTRRTPIRRTPTSDGGPSSSAHAEPARPASPPPQSGPAKGGTGDT
jgi:type IV secretion system protein TrbL